MLEINAAVTAYIFLEENIISLTTPVLFSSKPQALVLQLWHLEGICHISALS